MATQILVVIVPWTEKLLLFLMPVFIHESPGHWVYPAGCTGFREMTVGVVGMIVGVGKVSWVLDVGVVGVIADLWELGVSEGC